MLLESLIATFILCILNIIKKTTKNNIQTSSNNILPHNYKDKVSQLGIQNITKIKKTTIKHRNTFEREIEKARNDH